MNTATAALIAFAAAIAGLAAGQTFGLGAGTTGLVAFLLAAGTYGAHAARAQRA